MYLRLFLAFALLLLALPALAQHRVLTQGNGKLVIISRDGNVEWEMPWGGVHDLHMLENGNILAERDFKHVVEIDPKTKKEVWSYNAAEQNGNTGKPVEVHAFQPLPDGKFMIAESGPARIIEINRGGKLLKSIDMVVKNPNPHRDTRLARKLENGNYLVCHEGDGAVREYSSDGKLIWEFEIPLFDRQPADGHGPESFGNAVFGAHRLANGNTLIATGNGHSILEVDPDKKIVWQLHQNDLPGITLSWVTNVTTLPNGNVVFGNCHAGPGQPQIIEIKPRSKDVVWTFSHYDLLGNDISNTVLLD